jgi:sterol desaturase/sphingolipid hydroxylase (fatty acid hydroxylase superfamily)
MLDLLRPFAFSVGDYAFWLLIVSAACFIAERLFPWRKEQRALRRGFGQDLFWLAFHGHVFGVLVWLGSSAWFPYWENAKHSAGALALLASAPWPLQLLVALVFSDFLEYGVHNLLHRVPFLWQFHKVHHSIEELDFVGNFRFHPFESTVYSLLTALPVAALGVTDMRVWMFIWVFKTAIGHLNHSNLPISWGPLRYLFNSPKLHVWHHDVLLRGSAGRNFGVVFSCWDWIFGTAEMPDGQPKQLGFEGMERFPRDLPSRFLWPISALWSGRRSPAPSAQR